MKNKTIAFVNQKGGVGKSTIAALYASYLAYHKKFKVVVFDCDFPQHSLSGFRIKEKKMLGGDDLTMESYNNAISEVGEYSILEYPIDSIPEIISKLNEQHDDLYIIFDFPGTINLESFHNAINFIDFSIVPFGPSVSEFEATVMSLGTLFQYKPNMKVVSLLNRVKKIVNYRQNDALAFALRNSFKSEDFHFLNNKIYDLEGYKRDLITLTIDKDSVRVFDELQEIINS